MKRKSRLKNRIIKTVTFVMAVLFILATTAADSEWIVPKVVMIATEIYLLLFLIANRDIKIRW